MRVRLGAVTLEYAEHGSGVPLVALHGAGVDHREVEVAIEAIAPAGCRRIYPDLPGVGGTTADGLTSNDEVVALLGDFLDHLDVGPVLLLGHSYGAYLARGLAARRPDAVRGLALVCPIGERTGDVPDQEAVREDADAHDELDAEQRAGFDEYFVVRTADTARRYRDHVVPATTTADEDALGRIFAGWSVEVAGTFAGPTLIVAGRHDSVVGYVDASALLADYPQAGLAVLADAGHALMHEQPDLLGALLTDWVARALR